MNLKERGVTVGDLLITSIIIISTIFFINKAKDSDKQSQININPNNISNTLILNYGAKGNSISLPL